MDKSGQYGDFDLFEAEVNGMLVRCGYGELYYRNPYDCLFGYCAAGDDPLGRLQDCMDAYWVEK